MRNVENLAQSIAECRFPTAGCAANRNSLTNFLRIGIHTAILDAFVRNNPVVEAQDDISIVESIIVQIVATPPK